MTNSSPHSARSHPLGLSSDIPAAARAAGAVTLAISYCAVYAALDLAAAAREQSTGTNVSLWYAPAAISMALLLRFGPAWALLYFLVAWTDNYLVWGHDIRAEPFSGVLLAGFPAAVYSLCTWVLTRLLRVNPQLSSLKSAATFSIAIMIASAIVATGYTSVLAKLAPSDQPITWHTTMDFWIGDVVAILSITPFLLTIVFPWWSSRIAQFLKGPGRIAQTMHVARVRMVDGAATTVWLAVLAATIAFCVFQTQQAGRAFVYPCFIPLVFAAFWRGIKGAATGTVLVSASLAVFVQPDIAHAELHDLQLFLIVLCLTALLLGAAIASAKQATRELQQVHGIYRQAITAADAVPYVREYDSGRYTYVGDGIEKITGFSAREFTPELWEDRSQTVAMHGEMAGLTAEEAIRRTRSGDFRTWSSEEKFLARDGSIRWVADSSVEVMGDEGVPVQSIGMLQDISRLKQTEDALRASQAILELFVEHVPAAVAMLDRDLRYLAVSQRWLADYRLSAESVLGRCHYDVFPEIRDNRDWIDVHQRCLRGAVEKRDEDRFVRSDGTDDWLRWEVRPWYDHTGDIGGIVMFTEVVTERKRAEEAIRRSEEQLELALSGADLGLWDLVLADAHLSVNPRLADMIGFPMESTPTDPEIWLSHSHPDDFLVVSDHMWRHVTGALPNLDLEFRMHTVSGKPIWVHLRGKVVEWGPGGVPLRLSGTLQDITGRKVAEEDRRAFEDQLQQTQKLESLGVLAGGIAHDFNNLLVGILGNADLALAELPSDSPLRDGLEAIVTSSERAAELCRQMLAYSGRGQFVVAPVSLNAIVEELRQLLSVTVSKRAAMFFEPGPGLPLVKADATQLRQIVMNLITNASEAIGDRDGAIRMATDRCVWPGDEPGQHVFGGELRDGQPYVYVRVADTGSGMDHTTLQRIFDPFFTTKFTGRGLGLAAVLGIVRGHQGAIQVESDPGAGSTFTVYLPALDGDAVEAPRQLPSLPAQRGEGIVLVVDDEESVLAIAKTMLERHGFEAVATTDGEEALRIVRERNADIVLAIVDLTMPRIAGGELIRAIHAIKPDLRVILSSGYNEQDAVAQSHGETVAGFIQKPYRTREFHAAIRAALYGGQ